VYCAPHAVTQSPFTGGFGRSGRVHRNLFEVRQRARLLSHAGVPDCGDRQWIAHRSSGLHRLIHDWLAERLLHDDVRRRVDCRQLDIRITRA